MALAILHKNRVNEVFFACIFEDGDPSELTRVEGITMTNIGFSSTQLEARKDEIEEMIGELPVDFHESGPGGASFLAASHDKHGRQWAWLHADMEQLLLLGMGVERVELVTPPEVWERLPGRMPYYVIKEDH